MPLLSKDPLEEIVSLLKKSLPAQLEKHLSYYESVTSSEPPCDREGFKRWYESASAALVHIDQILKMIRWLEDGALPEDPMADLLSSARAALDALDGPDGQGYERS